MRRAFNFCKFMDKRPGCDVFSTTSREVLAVLEMLNESDAL